MKLIQIFPNIKPGKMIREVIDIPAFEIGYDYLKSGTQDKCAICGSLCDFIEIKLECMICSTECDKRAWSKKYAEERNVFYKNMPIRKRMWDWVSFYVLKFFGRIM